MKTIFKKMLAGVTAFALATSMLVGVSLSGTTAKAADNLLDGATWIHTHEAWQWNPGGWYDDGLVADTVVTDTTNGFSANIALTGWQRQWEETKPEDGWMWQNGWCDNPYQLTSRTNITVASATTYKLKFDINNNMVAANGTATEKNVTVTVNSGIENDQDNIFLFKTVRVPANGTYSFEENFTTGAEYSGNAVIEIAYGAYAYSFELAKGDVTEFAPAKYVYAPGTTEDVNAKGVLTFSNISAEVTDYEVPTTNKPEDDTSITTVSKYAIKNWIHTHEPQSWNDGGWYDDAPIGNTQAIEVPGGFVVSIPITGWAREWAATMPADGVLVENGWCDNPYQLTSESILSVKPGHTYDLKFDIVNKMKAEGGTATEKNVTITVNSGIEGDVDNQFVFETVRIPANETLNYSKVITIPETYTGGSIKIQLAYGAYAYSYEVEKAGRTDELKELVPSYIFAPGTTEGVNANGTLKFTNTEFKDQAPEETTTQKPTGKPTVKPTTPAKPTVKAPKKAKIKKVYPKKKSAKKVKLTIRKIKNVKGYEVQVSKAKKFKKKNILAKKTSTKNKVTVKSKKLKNKKKLYVRARAYRLNGKTKVYGKWSKAKKVRIKK